MFYLTKRIDEKQCTVGDRCMVLADFIGIPAGTKGTIIEIYDEGVVVKWLPCDQCAEGEDCHAAPTSDGFSREELEYLAFETEKHPKVDAKVNNINH